LPDHFQVYPPQPNPFLDKASFSFYLPYPTEANIKLLDGNGRILLEQQKMFPRGFNTFDIDFQGNTASGLLFYKIESAAGNAAGKIIRMP
jgi:hypothetical protein